ncbi:FHA domain-containing protein [Microbacterium sp. NPDC056052]|uniref:FHA domain-containing protein n=1 Tax=Microbacterium sp. NPDC056052 TaxID=3345695 RepID=UPI0035D7E4CB
MNTVYRAGSWFALIGPEAVVALPPDAGAALVERLWERVGASEVAFSDVVDALTAAGGGSFSAIPPFAAVVREGENARVAVRGRVLARVLTADGEREITGAEVTTWSERFVPGMTGVEIRVEDGGEDPSLPIVAGIVRAASIAVGAAASAPAVEESLSEVEPEVASAPAPASEPEPEPAPEPVSVSQPVSGLAPEPEPETDPAGAAEPAGEPEPAPPVLETLAGTTTQDPVPSSDDLDDIGDTVLSMPAPVETILPPADTIAAPLGGHTLDLSPASTAAPVAQLVDDGDHDGATISLAQARAMRGDLAADLSSDPSSPIAGTDVPAPISAVPVSSAPGIAEEPAAAAAHTAGPRIRLSSGQVVALDRTVVIGRRPRATRSSGATLPHLVAVDSPQQDISRSHLEIRPETDAVVVLDLHTTNGSTLLRPGSDPVRLHPGEQTIVVTGDLIDLGDGITVAFEELP